MTRYNKYINTPWEPRNRPIGSLVNSLYPGCHQINNEPERWTAHEFQSYHFLVLMSRMINLCIFNALSKSESQISSFKQDVG